jgi:ribonuclease Z
MVNNVPYDSLTFGDYTIEGYSRAAVQTCWRIPEMRLGFDLGAQPWTFMGTPNWFISHTHLDHVAALPLYISRRRMMKMEPPTIYMPAETIDATNRMLRAFSRLDRGRLPCELVGLEPDQEIELSRELVVTTHATIHSVPSLGFTVWERRKKLKPEYSELSGEQIRDLRLSGTEVSAETRMPRLSYLGDSRPEGLDQNPIMYESDILIMELTFVAPKHRKEKIHKFGHLHLDDLLARQDKFKNQLVIASHFSSRYHPRQVHQTVERALPDMLDGRLKLWIESE